MTEVQNVSDCRNWNYCSSKENPADLLMRGLKLRSLNENSLLWLGLPWLTCFTGWPGQSKNLLNNDDMSERCKNILVNECTIEKNELVKILENFSSIQKLL